MNKYLLTLFIVLSHSCAKSVDRPRQLYTPQFIAKQNIVYPNRMEATPIVWKQRLLYIVSDRMEKDNIEIYDGNKIVYKLPSKGKLISAITDKNILYIFSTTDHTKAENEVLMTQSEDLASFSKPIIIFKASVGQTIFNTSVAKDNDGFVMAYEVCENSIKCFSFRFIKSTDLLNWHSVGDLFRKDEYTACPTIKYINGYYYVFYLKLIGGRFSTYVSKSKNLIQFFESPFLVLSSLGQNDEGINNSDIDLIEFEGKTYINYADGNQSQNNEVGWTNVRLAVYDGSIAFFVRRIFFSWDNFKLSLKLFYKSF